MAKEKPKDTSVAGKIKKRLKKEYDFSTFAINTTQNMKDNDLSDPTMENIRERLGNALACVDAALEGLQEADSMGWDWLNNDDHHPACLEDAEGEITEVIRALAAALYNATRCRDMLETWIRRHKNKR